MGTFMAGDLATGFIRVRNIPATSGSAEVKLNAAGTITCDLTLPLQDPVTGNTIPFVDLIQPTKSFLAYVEGGKIVNAGPIWSDAYDFDTRKLTLNAAGLLSYWEHRFVLPVLAAGESPAGKDTVLNGMSLRTIAKRLIQQAQTWTGGTVPVVLEDDFTGDADRTYKGSDLQQLAEKLQQLSGVINGPDIAFRPRYAADRNYIEWVMATGDPDLKQDGPDHVWDMSAPTLTIRGAQISRDGTTYETNDYQVGSTPDGTTEPLIAVSDDATLLSEGFPLLEGSTSRSSVSVLQTLQDYADAAVATGRKPVETWSFEAKIDTAPTVADYDVGHFARIVTKNDPRVGTDRHRVRMMGYKVTLGNPFVKVDCLPEREVGNYPIPVSNRDWLDSELGRRDLAIAEANRRAMAAARHV